MGCFAGCSQLSEVTFESGSEYTDEDLDELLLFMEPVVFEDFP
jgi:hypothetical protein